MPFVEGLESSDEECGLHNVLYCYVLFFYTIDEIFFLFSAIHITRLACTPSCIVSQTSKLFHQQYKQKIEFCNLRSGFYYECWLEFVLIYFHESENFVDGVWA